MISALLMIGCVPVFSAGWVCGMLYVRWVWRRHRFNALRWLERGR